MSYILKHDDREHNQGYNSFCYFSRYCRSKGKDLNFEFVHEDYYAKHFYFRRNAEKVVKKLNRYGWKFKVVKRG